MTSSDTSTLDPVEEVAPVASCCWRSLDELNSVVPWFAPSVNELWSSHTFVAPLSVMLSYSEFQLPVSPSVGDQVGKQSYASSNAMLRMMTLPTFGTSRLPPLMRALRSP